MVNPRISALLFPASGVRLLLLLFLFSSCSLHGTEVPGDPAGAGTVVVRASFREAALPGARVEFLRFGGEAGGTPVASGVTDREGVATFRLPPDRYLLVARWTRGGDFSRPLAPGDRHAWFGGNPVHVARGTAGEIFLGLEEFAEPPATVGERPGGTGVAGRVLSTGVPVEGASVFAHVRTSAAFRDPGFASSVPTGEDGSFVIDLPPGDYYLLVRKRASGGIAGPMRKGDLYGYFPGNPVSVRSGEYRLLSINAIPLKLRNVPSYSGRNAGAALVEGRIVGTDGRPRSGVYAALYDNPFLLNRPVFLSDVTGGDGRFRLSVPVPGVYFLGARSGYGGAPRPGDFYGRYEGNADHSLTIREGDHLEGIDITVTEVR
jgi:hypothetical protein